MIRDLDRDHLEPGQLGRDAVDEREMNTAMKFIARLSIAVSDTDSGITIRGNRIFRSIPSCARRH